MLTPPLFSSAGLAPLAAPTKPPLPAGQVKFGRFTPPAHHIIRAGEKLNLWFDRLSRHSILKKMFPGTSATQPIFRLNIKETLPTGLGALLLLYIHGQQKNKAAHGQPFDPDRSAKIAGEAALSHGLLATTQYVYPALGVASWAYIAGKEPTLGDKIDRGLKILLSMMALATGSYLGMGYTLNQTRQDIKSIKPLLTTQNFAQWNTALEKWWHMPAPEHVSPEHWANLQQQARKGWQQFLHRAQTSVDDPLKNPPLTGKRKPMRPAATTLLTQFDNDIQQARHIPKKYRARQQVINAFSRLYKGLQPLQRLQQERPDTRMPKTLQQLSKKLATVNQPYIRLSRFLTPIAFGVLLNQLAATPLHRFLSGSMQLLTPGFIQRARARVNDDLGWLDMTPNRPSVTTTYPNAIISPTPNPTPTNTPLWQSHFNDSTYQGQ